MRTMAITLTLVVGGLCLTGGVADAKTTAKHHTTSHHTYTRHHKTVHHRRHKKTTTSRHSTRRTAPRRTATNERLPWMPPTADGVAHGGAQLISLMEQHLGTNPTGWAHNWCGHMLDLTLRQAGFSGGGNLAAAYAHYGRPARPQVGAIAVMPHHVGVVMSVGQGMVTLISGNHGHRVGIGKYPMSRIMAFRMAA